MDEASRLRLRSALSSWLLVLLIVAIAIGGVGAWATYTAHVDTGTTTEQRTTTAWTATGEFDHSATVTRENPLYPIGTELTNRSTYFRSAAPVVDGQFAVRQQGLSENVTVDLGATLVLESADEESTYWTDRQELNTTTVTNARTDPVTVGFSLNVTEVADRIAVIEDGLGSTPGETTAAVVVDARIAGMSDGERSQLTFTRRLPVGLGGDTYVVSAPGATEEAVSRTAAVEVPREYGLLRSVGGPLALLFGAVATGALAYGTRSDQLALSDTERARLDYLDDRSEFDEWIVSARLPAVAEDRAVAEASSLADLVNLAIDSDAAVVEDPDDSAFHVVTGEYRYTFRPPAPTDADAGMVPELELDPDNGGTTEDANGTEPAQTLTGSGAETDGEEIDETNGRRTESPTVAESASSNESSAEQDQSSN